LRSTRWAHEEQLYVPDTYLEAAEFLDSWIASLIVLEWTSGETNLVCNDALLERLQDAKEVRIISHKISPSWVLNLLSSSPSLRKAEILCSLDSTTETVDDTQEMNLPNLDNLYLTAPPKSKATGDVSLFFENLKTPVLKVLQLQTVNLKDLSSMKVDSTPSSRWSMISRSRIQSMRKQRLLPSSTRYRTGRNSGTSIFNFQTRLPRPSTSTSSSF